MLLALVASTLAVVASPGALSSVSPTGASADIAININGTGFNITAAKNEVMFIPASGQPIPVTPSRITTGTTLMRLTVTVPRGLPAGRTAIRVRNTANGDVGDGVSIDLLTLTLPDVATAPQGSRLDVRIVGSANSAFIAGNSRAVFGTGITVNSTTVTAANALTANITVAGNAALGPRTVGVASTNQQAVVVDAFTVTAPPPPNRHPTANAGGPYGGETGASISFSGSGIDPDNDPLTLAWAFGDGGTATGASPSHSYAAAGPYTATLTVADGRGGSGTSTAAVTVTAPPPPNRNPTAEAGGPYGGMAGTTISFSGSGSDPDNDPLTLAWAFGDGGTATGASPSHTYAAAGPYTATLTVTDGRGGSATSTVAVTVTAPPPPNRNPTAAVSGPAEALAGDSVSLDGRASSDPDSDSLTYAWTFGDGTAQADGPASLTHVYAAPGSYTVSLTVSDGHGGLDTATATIRVSPRNLAPVVNAGPAGVVTLPASAVLAGSASDDGLPAGGALTIGWSKVSGPGAVTFANPASAATSAAFALPGVYLLRLTAGDSLLSASGDVQITVSPNGSPVARPGGPYAGSTGQVLTFDGSGSSDPENEPLTYNWTFGDGSSATGAVVTHAFPTADTYTVTLTVRDPEGNRHAAPIAAAIGQANRPPLANAGGSYAADAGATLVFSGAGSSDPDGNALSFAWSFGDGASGSGAAPTHAYLTPGTYTVNLTVTDTHGQSASASTSATVVPAQDRAPPAVSLFGPREALPGAQVLVTASASDNVGVASVTFDVDGSAPTTSTAVPYERVVTIPSLASPGSVVDVRGTARDAAGNTGVAHALIIIVAAPDTVPPVVTLTLPPGAAAGSTVRLSASATDAGGVASVTFLNGSTVIGTDRTPPYEAVFLIPAGTAVGTSLPFTARAADFAGNVADSVGALQVTALPDTEPPVVSLTAPADVLPGATLRLSATASDNVKVSSVSFVVDGVTLITLLDGPYTLKVPIAGSRTPGSVIHARAVATDATGLEGVSDADIRVAAPPSGTGGIVGEVYDDTTGLPLMGATATLVNAADRSAVTDAQGRYDLAADAGLVRLRITHPGFTTADRTVAVQGDIAATPFDARLTPIPAAGPAVSAVLGGAVADGAAALTIAAGALPADAVIQIVRVTPQGLQGPLPRGWSPVSAIDILPHGATFGVEQQVVVTGAAAVPGTGLVLAAWDESAAGWRAVASTSAAPDGALSGAVPGSGQYAWLLADSLPAAPPVPPPGVLVAGVDDGVLPDAAAVQVAPQPRVVFYKPGVRSQVSSSLRPGAALPSGTPLQSRITESYRFTSGAEIQAAPFSEDIVFYQAAGQPTLLAAAFPVTPSRTFDPQDLQQGTITVELRTAAVPGLPIVGPAGGTVRGAGGETLAVPASALNRPVPVSTELLPLGEAGVQLPPGLRFLGAVSIGLPPAALQGAAVLSIPRPVSFDDNSPVVVLQVVEVQQATRLLLTATARPAGSKIQSERTVPGSPLLLRGIVEAGRYVFAQGIAPLGFAAGVVSDDTGRAVGNVLVSADGLPIVGVSAATGQYALAAAGGAASLTAIDPASLAVGSAQGLVAAASTVAIDIRLAARTLQVAGISPAEGAASVGLSAPVAVTFSAPIDPASLAVAGQASLTVADAAGVPVAGALSLSEGSRKLTFRPSGPLAANTSYTVTVGTTVRDVTGRALAAVVVSHFRSLDTSAPAVPAAGSVTATIPGASGTTTVTATQGAADPHDTVQILNLTRRTFFPALVNPDGSFSATFAVRLGDKLQIAITDPSGNQTLVSLPPFSRTNADGSLSTVVGSDGGRVGGPGGIAVDVPGGALSDGTIVTVGRVDESSLPSLSAAQKTFFQFSGGVRLDFSGTTPSHYVNVSLPAAAGDTTEDRWLVVQLVNTAGQAALNIVDTARVINGRITTASPPCPGVQAAAVYGMFKSVQRSVGVGYGRFVNDNPDPFAVARITLTETFAASGFGAGAVGFPFSLLATPSPVDVCLPVLSGRVTVQPNSQKVVIPASAFTPNDREIVVRNQTSGREFHYPRNVAEYRFLVDGSLADTFEVSVVAGGQPQPVDFKASVAGPGLVNVRLDVSKVNASISAVSVRNLSRTPVAERTFPAADAAVSLDVEGAAGDALDVVLVKEDGTRRGVGAPQIQTPTQGNLVARALPATIDPDTDVFLERFDGNSGQMVERLPIPDEARRLEGGQLYGGFVFRFVGDPAANAFRVVVQYRDGRSPDSIAIPRVALTISNPVTGQVIRTFNVLVPPQDEPFNLGSISGDTTPPILTGAPTLLDTFDPSGQLSFSFSEGLNRDSALSGVVLRSDKGAVVTGQVRLTNANRTLTFVPDAPLALGTRYTVTLQGLTDGSGNLFKTATFDLSTFSPSEPRPIFTANGALQALKHVTLVRDTVAGRPRTLAFGVAAGLLSAGDSNQLVIIDITDPATPQLLSATPSADVQRVTVVQGVQLTTFGVNPCSGQPVFAGDLAIVSSTTVGRGSAVRFFDVTNRAAPCLAGAKLLSLTPSSVGSNGTATIRADGAVLSDLGFARGVTYLWNGPRLNAFIAVENVGLLQVDVGNAIGRLTTEEGPEPLAAGNYTDVRAVNDRLLAIDRSAATLDIFNGSLALISSTPVGLRQAIALTNASALPLDLNRDGQIGQSEVRDLAFVGGVGGVSAVDITSLSAPVVLGQVPMAGTIWQLDIDLEKRRLLASGTVSDPGGEFALFTIDLSGPDPFSNIDSDADGIDDRVSWRTPPGQYPFGASNFRALAFDAQARVLYAGAATSATGAGGLESWSFDNVCCDLSLDLARANVVRPSSGTEDRNALLLRERKALQVGMTAGLAEAASCGVPISTTTDAVKGSGKLAILEQGSGACLWRLVRPDGSLDPQACGKNYQPGLSDHDFEVFMPEQYFQGAVGSRPADCVVSKLSAQFVNDDDTPKAVSADGAQVAFDDITFFPFRKEGFDTGQLDIELPQNKSGDTLGDLAMGRQNLLLLWLLGGDYVQLASYNVKGEPLDVVMETLKHVTLIPKVEGYEWANLQRFNLLKSKAFLRIAGASSTESAFHDLYVKQLHDAAKAAIRTTFARMVADEQASAVVLDVRRTAASPGTGPSYRDNACANLPDVDPSTWTFTKACEGFEEYVLAAAARTVTTGQTLFTAAQVHGQVQKFWRIKADVPPPPSEPADLPTEAATDQFLGDLARFVGGADVGGDVDPAGGVIAATRPAYDAAIGSDPRAAKRTENLQKVQAKILSASREISLHVIPHVANRGFTDAGQVEVSMYRGDGVAPGTRVRPLVPNDPKKPADPLRVDVVRDTDAFLATGADTLPDGAFDDVSPEERNLNDLARHEASRKKPLFSLGDPRLKTRPGDPPDPAADAANPLLDLNPTPVRWVAFTIDLPDRPAVSKQKEANRQNNFDGLYYYVLDRSGQPPPPASKVPFPGADSSVLAPDTTCGVSPDLTVTQSITVRGSTYTDEASLLPGEGATLEFRVANPTLRDLTDVRVCSEITHDCYPLGTVAAGGSRDQAASYTAPLSASVIEALVSASSREAGVRIGAPLRLTVGCSVYAVAPLDPDPNPVLPGMPNTSPVEQGGTAVRYYRVVDRQTGQPLANAPVRAQLEVPGGAPMTLDFVTDAQGVIVSPDAPGMSIPYPANVPPGTTATVRITDINGATGSCAANTTFGLALTPRAFTSTLSAGASLQAEGKLEGYNLTDKAAFGISGTLNSTTAGPSTLVFGRSLANTAKVGVKAKNSQSIDFGVDASLGKVEASANLTSALMTRDDHTFAWPLSNKDLFALSALAVSAAYAAPLSAIPSGPVLFRVLDEVFERATGLDATRTGVGVAGALGAEAGASAKSFNLTLGKADSLNSNINSAMGVTAGISAAVDAAVVLSVDASPKEAPPLLTAGIEYRAQGNWSVGANLAITHELAGQARDTLLSQKEIIEKLQKSLDFVQSMLNSTGALAGNIKFSLILDAQAVKVKGISFSIAQRKQYGFVFLGDTLVDQGDGRTRRVTYRITDRDPAKLAKAIEQLAVVQAALVGTAIGGPILTPIVLGSDVLAEQMALLISYADDYDMTVEAGKGIPIPFGLSRLLKGTDLEKDVSAEFSLNFDSVTRYVSERGAVRRGGMFPLERYPDPDPLVTTTSADQIVQAISDAKAVVETITNGLRSVTQVIGKVTAIIDKRFSPSGVRLEIDGAAEPDSPEPFEVDLFAFQYTALPPELVPLVQNPADVGGAIDRPHYGIGGFFQFVPGNRVLAAPAKLAITYLDPEVASLDESSLAIYRWNEDRNDWDFVGGTVDAAANTVTTMVTSLGLYTLGVPMPAGEIAFTPTLSGAIDPQQPTIVTFTSAPIAMNTGGAVPDGTPFSVYTVVPDSDTLAQFGTITTPDVDPLTVGAQVASHGGVIAFTVSLPPGMTQPMVVGFAPRGTAFGSAVIPLK